MKKEIIFELEEKIMDCWNITSDLETMLQMLDNPLTTQDDIMNVLIGLKTLYATKFSNLIKNYEEVIHEYFKLKEYSSKNVNNTTTYTMGHDNSGTTVTWKSSTRNQL
jgi:hypothetical protein